MRRRKKRIGIKIIKWHNQVRKERKPNLYIFHFCLNQTESVQGKSESKVKEQTYILFLYLYIKMGQIECDLKFCSERNRK